MDACCETFPSVIVRHDRSGTIGEAILIAVWQDSGVSAVGLSDGWIVGLDCRCCRWLDCRAVGRSECRAGLLVCLTVGWLDCRGAWRSDCRVAGLSDYCVGLLDGLIVA